MPTLLAPSGNSSILVRSGVTYTSDAYGVIRDVPMGTDVQDLEAAGCSLVRPGRFPLFALMGADMTSTEDQQLETTLGGANYYSISKIVAVAASAPITAVGGIYTQRDKDGDAVVAAAQSWALAGADPSEMV